MTCGPFSVRPAAGASRVRATPIPHDSYCCALSCALSPALCAVSPTASAPLPAASIVLLRARRAFTFAFDPAGLASLLASCAVSLALAPARSAACFVSVAASLVFSPTVWVASPTALPLLCAASSAVSPTLSPAFSALVRSSGVRTCSSWANAGKPRASERTAAAKKRMKFLRRICCPMYGLRIPPSDCMRRGSRPGRVRDAPHQVELVVGAHAGRVREPVAHGEERRDGGDVPAVLVREAVLAQAGVVGVLQLRRPQRHFEREVQDGALPRSDVRLAVVDRYLIGQ